MYDVRHVLRKAGLRSTYSGYNYLASAVALVLKDQEFYLKNVSSAFSDFTISQPLS